MAIEEKPHTLLYVSSLILIGGPCTLSLLIGPQKNGVDDVERPKITRWPRRLCHRGVVYTSVLPA